MRTIVFLLEEPSAKEMLNGVLPRLLPSDCMFICVVFEGKQDLEKRFPKYLKSWKCPNSLFVVLRDQDSGNCVDIKAKLSQKCMEAKKPDTLIRIACHELETFFLGDLDAVSKSFGSKTVAKLQNNKKFKNPDRLANPAEELKKIAPEYQKISGSRAIGPILALSKNRSDSFKCLVLGIQKLVDQ